MPQKIALTAGTVQNKENLLDYKTLQIGLNEPQVCTLCNENGENAFAVLDFGIEMQGGIRILSARNSGGYPQIRLTFGESLAEALSSPGVKGAVNDHSVRDFTVTVPQLSDQEWGNTGFRYVKMELLTPDCSVQIKSAVGVFVYRDYPYKGYFESSDELLDKIYAAAAYTCHLNLQNMVWDGIKRDRLVWIGDMHPEMLTVRSVFGNIPLIAQSIDFAREQTPLPGWMSGMPSYSMWWIRLVHDWFMYTGDEEFLHRQGDYILELLRQLTRLVDFDGSDRVPSYFLDWPTNDCENAKKAGVRALLKTALTDGAGLAQILGDKRLAVLCINKAGCLVKNPGQHMNRKQAAAIMFEAGILPAGETERIILQNGANGLSTYLSYYTLSALARSGKPEQALQLLKDYYGAMLDKGATTFFEDYDTSWTAGSGNINEIPAARQKDIHGDFGGYCYNGFRHSLCHGWASGPVPFVTGEILGIKILSPGCEAVNAEPNPCGLKYIHAAFPTPQGLIKIDCEASASGKYKTEIKTEDD